MNIAFLSTRLTKYDAISNYTVAILRALSRGNNVDIYAFSIEAPIPLHVNKYTYVRKNEHSALSFFLAFLKMYHLAKKFSKYDALVLSGPDIPILLIARLAKHFNPALKLIWDYHGLTPPRFLRKYRDKILTKFRSYFFFMSMKQSSCILVRSDYMKKEIRHIISEEKIRIVPFGIEIERFKNVDPSDVKGKYNLNGKFVLLYVGRLAWHKRIDFLINSMEKLNDVILLIVGEGEERDKLKRFVRLLNLQDKVIFVGKVSDEDLPKYYAASDVFVTASLHEGFCVPIIEAFASGKPVIVPDRTTMPEVAGDCGLVYDGSMEDFIDKINELKRNNVLRKRFGIRALERVKNFDINDISVLYEYCIKN